MTVLNPNFGAALRFPTTFFSASGSAANHALNTSYTHGSSGNAFGIRYESRLAEAITDAYVFMGAENGTHANLAVSAAIYNEHGTSATQSGTTSRASSSSVTIPSAASKWIKASFNSYTPTVGEVLWIVFWNSASNQATDYPSIQTATNTISSIEAFANAYTTTNGWSGAGTAAPEAMWMIVHSGGDVVGQPIQNTAALVSPSSTLTRGMIFSPPVDVEAYGVDSNAGSAAWTNLSILDYSQAPSDTPLYNYPLGTVTNASRDEVIGIRMFDTPVVFRQGERYRIVQKASSNLTTPSVGYIVDYASYSSVFDNMVDYFTVCPSCVDNGSGGWTNYMDRWNPLQLLVSGFPFPGSRAGFALGL